MASNVMDPFDEIDRALLVRGVGSVQPLYRTADKLTIHFQRKSNNGGDITQVIYPPNSQQDVAIVVFDDAKDCESSLNHEHVYNGRPLQVDRLPPIFRLVEAEIDPVYFTLLPDMVDNLMRRHEFDSSKLDGTNFYKLSVSSPSELKYAEKEAYRYIVRQSEAASIEDREFSSTDYFGSAKIQQTKINPDGWHGNGSRIERDKREDPDLMLNQSTPVVNSACQLHVSSSDPITSDELKQDGKKGSSGQESKLQGQASEHDDDGPSSSQQDNSILLDMFTYNYLMKYDKANVEKILKTYNVKINVRKEDFRVTFVSCKKDQPKRNLMKAVEDFTAVYQTTHVKLNRKTVDCPPSMGSVDLEKADKAALETSNLFPSDILITKIEGNPVRYIILGSGNIEEVAHHFRKLANIRSTKRLKTSTPVAEKNKTSTDPDLTNPPVQHGNASSVKSATASNSQSHWKEKLNTLDDVTFVTDEGVTIVIRQDDITRSNTYAIVNPSDPRLQNLGGAAKAVQNAAGHQLMKWCTDYIKRRNYLPMQELECCVSSGFKLDCTAIIHVVGPQSTSEQKFEDKLYQTFVNCLQLAEIKEMKSLSMPLICSGSIGASKEVCADTLADALINFSKTNAHRNLKEVHLVNIDSEATVALKKSFKAAFKTKSSVTSADQQAVRTNGATGSSLVSFSDDNSHVRGKNDIHIPPNKDHTRQKTNDYKLSFKCPNSDQVNNIPAGTEKAKSEMVTGIKMDERIPADSANVECPICLADKMVDVKVLQCKHKFCKECIEKALQQSHLCPVCRAVSGQPKGNQPKGTMEVGRSKYTPLPGYINCGVIIINYDIPSGIQSRQHPHPGRHFTGVSRTAYLPDNQEGNEVLTLLRKAFNADLVFTVGRSVSSGVDDIVTWNDIHHKTSQTGEPYGYPDPGYMKRLKEDLAAVGIV